MTIVTYVRRHSFIASFIIVVLLVIVIIMGRNSQKAVTAVIDSSKKVSVVSVATFREGNDIVSANGVVESRGQADLKSQMSAPVAVIHGAIGDNVYVGQIILELQNADTRAQLDQAKAALALAEGQYLTGGVSLDSARSAAIDKVHDSYLKGFEAVNTQIDPLLTNSDGNGNRLSSYITDTKLNNQILETRIDLTSVLRDWKSLADSLKSDSSPESILAAIRISSKNLSTIDGLLGNISQALNDTAKFSTPSLLAFINNWKAVVSGARASISGATASLTATEASFSNADTSYGSTAPAQVSAARAGVSNLEAQLAKTIIRSPINGKIAGLPLGVGELASPGQLLATVVSDSGLEVKAYASGEDLVRIKAGSPVTIQGNIKGVVDSVAPSVSSANRKVEVIIAVKNSDIATGGNQGNSGLVIGQNVQVSIQADKNSGAGSVANNSYTLPIQDIKIVPGEAYVFTIDADSKIRRNPVTLGEVKGDFIQVIGGLTDDMNIVSPVYELDEGEVVTVQ